MAGESDAEREARHHRAIAVCRACPPLDRCRDLLDPRASGVWAGEVLDGRGGRQPTPQGPRTPGWGRDGQQGAAGPRPNSIFAAGGQTGHKIVTHRDAHDDEVTAQ